jgi:hypothetical protein
VWNIMPLNCIWLFKLPHNEGRFTIMTIIFFFLLFCEGPSRCPWSPILHTSQKDVPLLVDYIVATVLPTDHMANVEAKFEDGDNFLT